MVPKLGDVAKLAGVSSTTVSRVINNYGSLSQKTKAKVFDAMHQLGYQPNVMARSLQGKSSKFIGLILPNLTTPIFSELTEVLETKLFDLGYKVIIAASADNPKKERQYLEMLLANQVEGIISGSHNLGIATYNNVELPIVSFDRFLGSNIPIVSSDNFGGGKLAARYLLDHGARNLAVIMDDDDSGSPTAKRALGFREVVLRSSEPTNLTIKTYSEKLYSPAQKMTAIEADFKNDQFDGVFAFNDETAMLVIQAARNCHIQIPSDLQIIGYDGTHFSRTFTPQLASIIQPIEKIGDQLIALLLHKIQTPKKIIPDPAPIPVSLYDPH